MNTVTIDGVTIHLAHPDELSLAWVGDPEPLKQLLAAWMTLGDGDHPLHPRLLGKPGVGKTTLAYTAARTTGKDAYIFQATMDTRPEDLLISPVIESQGRLKYVASSLVTAMIRGGVCILDEGNRMSEKSWASLAPLLDTRGYIESIVSGIKVKAHPEFRFVATMNDDSSTFEIPEYIHSRLQPQIFIGFPCEEDEYAILKENLPYAGPDVLQYVVDFLQAAHDSDESFTARDGINVARFALRLLKSDGVGAGTKIESMREAMAQAVRQSIGDAGLAYLPRPRRTSPKPGSVDPGTENSVPLREDFDPGPLPGPRPLGPRPVDKG